MTDIYPTISIITPSFNQGPFIERTIQSVLQQDYPNFEYIIMDGGSTDQTVDIIRRYDNAVTHWVSEQDEGQAHAVNKGIAKANGEIIGWLNSDDIYYPGALKAIAAEFGNNPSAEIIYGEGSHINVHDEAFEQYPTEPWNYERLKVKCFLCQPAVFFKKSVVDELGPLDQSLDFCMDYEFWLRLGQKYEFHQIESTLAGSRMYPDNKTLRDRQLVYREIVGMFHQKFGRVPKKWLAALAHFTANPEDHRPGPFEERRKFMRRALSRYRYYLLRYNRTIELRTTFREIKKIREGDMVYYINTRRVFDKFPRQP